MKEEISEYPYLANYFKENPDNEVKNEISKPILKNDIMMINRIICEKEITKTDIERGLLVIPKKLISLSKHKGEKMWIKDGNIDFSPYLLYNDKDNNNLRFGGLKEWYRDRKITPGTEINISFDENELDGNLHVIHIEYVEK